MWLHTVEWEMPLCVGYTAFGFMQLCRICPSGVVQRVFLMINWPVTFRWTRVQLFLALIHGMQLKQLWKWSPNWFSHCINTDIVFPGLFLSWRKAGKINQNKARPSSDWAHSWQCKRLHYLRELQSQATYPPDEAARTSLFTRSTPSIYVWDVQIPDALEGYLIWRGSSRQPSILRNTVHIEWFSMRGRSHRRETLSSDSKQNKQTFLSV